MNNPTPPRAPELQAALDVAKFPDLVSHAEVILAAEVYRLEEQVRTLRTALASAELWHSGDKWRFSKDPKERECWEGRNTEIKAALAQPSETKETKS